VTLETAEQLADLLVDAGDLIAAWKLRRQLLEWYRSAYGEDFCSDFGVCYSFGVSKIHLQFACYYSSFCEKLYAVSFMLVIEIYPDMSST